MPIARVEISPFTPLQPFPNRLHWAATAATGVRLHLPESSSPAIADTARFMIDHPAEVVDGFRFGGRGNIETAWRRFETRVDVRAGLGDIVRINPTRTPFGGETYDREQQLPFFREAIAATGQTLAEIVAEVEAQRGNSDVETRLNLYPGFLFSDGEKPTIKVLESLWVFLATVPFPDPLPHEAWLPWNELIRTAFDRDHPGRAIDEGIAARFNFSYLSAALLYLRQARRGAPSQTPTGIERIIAAGRNAGSQNLFEVALLAQHLAGEAAMAFILDRFGAYEANPSDRNAEVALFTMFADPFILDVLCHRAKGANASDLSRRRVVSAMFRSLNLIGNLGFRSSEREQMLLRIISISKGIGDDAQQRSGQLLLARHRRTQGDFESAQHTLASLAQGMTDDDPLHADIEREQSLLDRKITLGLTAGSESAIAAAEKLQQALLEFDRGNFAEAARLLAQASLESKQAIQHGK